MTEWLLVLLVLVLIGANAVFVAAEFSFVTVDRPTVARLAETDRRARSLDTAIRRLSTQLSGAQLGITVTSLVVGYIAEPSVATLLRGPLQGLGLDEAAAAPIALTAAFLLVTWTQMVFGELVPKNWAISEPLRIGRAVADLQRGFTWLAHPLLVVLQGAANGVVRLLGLEPQEELASARSAQELGALVGRSAEHGLLDEDAARRLEHSVEFTERTAADAMTPRPRVRFLDSSDTAQDVLVLTARSGHARFPVLGRDVDDVVGVVHFKHALAVPPAERATRTAGSIARPVHAVPSAMPLDAVLDVLREGLQLAVVVDEYGGTDGIVTLEDLVEEIVGEIQDEQDRPLSRHRRLADGAWSLSGLLRPDEASEIVDVELPEGRESDTLGGLVIERLERFPEVGDEVVLEGRDTSRPDELGIAPPVDVRVRVMRLDGHRVDRLRLSVETTDADRPDDGPDGDARTSGDARGAQDDQEVRDERGARDTGDARDAGDATDAREADDG